MPQTAAHPTGQLRNIIGAFADRLASRKTRYVFCVAMIYALPIQTFTTPTLETTNNPSIDSLVLVKLAILAFSIFGGLALLYCSRRSPQTQETTKRLLPFCCFFGWCLLTVTWSPMKAYSLSQAGGLASLIILANHLGALASDKITMSRLMRHLCYSLIAFSGFILAVHIVDPDLSGLDRKILHQGGDGIVHPTASGASSGLGVALAVLGLTVMKFPWSKHVVLLTMLINVPVMYLSHSRSATAMTVAVIALAVFWFTSVRTKAVLAFLASLFCVVYVAIDPGFTLLGSTFDRGLEYLTRGQDVSQLKGASGRREMWTAIWAEYRHSPVCGHGYAITSRNGEIEVWNIVANHTAHNLILQILASTGLVGLCLFLFAVGKATVSALQLFRSDRFSRHLAALFALMALWFVGWSFGCVSFIGPLRSESVVFYSLLGLCLGEMERSRLRQIAAETR
ncbi:MAG: O-antigen ligase family protein [Planctomycetota bacterium]